MRRSMRAPAGGVETANTPCFPRSAWGSGQGSKTASRKIDNIAHPNWACGPVLETAPFRTAIHFEVTSRERSRTGVVCLDWQRARSFVASRGGFRAQTPETNIARETAQAIQHPRGSALPGHGQWELPPPEGAVTAAAHGAVTPSAAATGPCTRAMPPRPTIKPSPPKFCLPARRPTIPAAL
jgi:hypothetical protein